MLRGVLIPWLGCPVHAQDTVELTKSIQVQTSWYGRSPPALPCPCPGDTSSGCTHLLWTGGLLWPWLPLPRLGARHHPTQLLRAKNNRQAVVRNIRQMAHCQDVLLLLEFLGGRVLTSFWPGFYAHLFDANANTSVAAGRSQARAKLRRKTMKAYWTGMLENWRPL